MEGGGWRVEGGGWRVEGLPGRSKVFPTRHAGGEHPGTPVAKERAYPICYSRCRSFLRDPRELPIKWHQALLIFAQRYKNDISDAQKNVIKEVLRVHTHYMITPEIRRELFALQVDPAPCTLHPAPKASTLHPTPSTLHPTPGHAMTLRYAWFTV